MESRTINSLLRYVRNFIGTYPSDRLPAVNGPALLIANTDPAHRPGEHWVAIHLDGKGGGEYFDSYGLPPIHQQIIEYLARMCPLGFGYNTITLQCFTCITCGHYCVMYVKFKSKGKSYCDFIAQFSTNVNKNELIIRNFFK